MKKILFSFFLFCSTSNFSQEAPAYALFNASYATDGYTLVEDAKAYGLDTTDKVFLAQVMKVASKEIIRELSAKKSKPFKWDITKLRNTKVVAEPDPKKKSQNLLRLSAPLFDRSGIFALMFESYDTGTCINTGPVLFQYKKKEWTLVASHIVANYRSRGETIQKKALNSK